MAVDMMQIVTQMHQRRRAELLPASCRRQFAQAEANKSIVGAEKVCRPKCSVTAKCHAQVATIRFSVHVLLVESRVSRQWWQRLQSCPK